MYTWQVGVATGHIIVAVEGLGGVGIFYLGDAYCRAWGRETLVRFWFADALEFT